MFGAIKKWKTNRRPILETITFGTQNEYKNEQQQDVAPPRFLSIDGGEISLGSSKLYFDTKEKEIMEKRIFELEATLQKVQNQLKQSLISSSVEKDLKIQLESMSQTMKLKDRKAVQLCRDHKILQARFDRQEAILQKLQQENDNLQQRVRQYEICLDDVMAKVVDALVNEDSLREEVLMLKNRVKDLEEQNAALAGSPVKAKDEGYCTMSSGQPQPSNSQLEDLPEEPEQWLLAGEPCSGDMEDWSMSQDECGIISLEDVNDNENDWIWNSSYITSTMIESQSEGITKLLRDTIVYSDDEELACTDFTQEFYTLVNIPSTSNPSIHTNKDAESDDNNVKSDSNQSDNEESNCGSDEQLCIKKTKKKIIVRDNSSVKKLYNKRLTMNKNSGPSPTPSEAGRAFVTSCSSSESEEQLSKTFKPQNTSERPDKILSTNNTNQKKLNFNSSKRKFSRANSQSSMIPQATLKSNYINTPCSSSNTTLRISSISNSSSKNSPWKKSTGWKRITTNSFGKEAEKLDNKKSSIQNKSRIPPPVPVRRSFAS